jgi:hypothetical protein
MVTDIIHFVRIPRILYLNPNFLIEQVKENIAEQWGDICFAKLVISAADDQNRIVGGKVGHCVTESLTWSQSTSFYIDELPSNNFTIDSDWLEVPQLVIDQFAILCLPAKVIYTFEDLVTLKRGQYFV